MRPLLAVLALASALALGAQEPPGAGEAERVPREEVVQPALERDAAALLPAAILASFLIDDEVARIARNNDSAALDDLMEAVEPFGGGHSDKVMAAFLLYGIAAKDKRARTVAYDAFLSSVIASKGITPALKKLTRRERPNGGDDDAFPSNHATQAFAVASVVAEHYAHRPWVRWLAYSIATGVGLARIYHDAHWTSDVLAGAGIGFLVGKSVVRAHRAAVSVRGNGLVVSLTW